MRTATTDLSNFFAIKAKLKKEFSKPIVSDKEDPKAAKLRVALLFNYIMELREVEQKLDRISSKDVSFTTSEALFHMIINKYDNYDAYFEGDYVKLYEVYNYDLNNTTKWVVWCAKV